MSMLIDWKKTVFSDNTAMFVTPAEPKFGDEVVIRLRVDERAVDKINFVKIGLMMNGEQFFHNMKKDKVLDGFVYYSCLFTLTEHVLRYKFIIAYDDYVYFYNRRGVYTHFPTQEHDFKLIAGYHLPEWVKGAVFYQIFPERFCIGNPSNGVTDGEIDLDGFKSVKKQWDEVPGDGGWYEFYGGDLDGITKKLDYIQELGVDALYINPIFTADSSHKYDCLDYFNVDKHFGGNKALERLMEECRVRGLKVMLDISINHTGRKHKWVEENPEFYIPDENGGYERWNGVKSLYVLNYRSEKLADRIYRDADSVLKKWMKPPYSIDGWRFDVGHNFANMKGYSPYKRIWREIRNELREVNPDIYLIGEHVSDAAEFLQGDMWDGAMNYKGFVRPLRKLFGDSDWALDWQITGAKLINRDVDVFAAEVLDYWALLPGQVAMGQYNLLTCHDIDRFNSEAGFSETAHKAGLLFLFTFPGVANMYYGDEINIKGRRGSDAGRRFQMPWDEKEWDTDILEFYKKIIKYRKESDAIKYGAFMPLLMAGNVVSYARFDEKSCVVLVYSPKGGEIEINLDGVGRFMEAEFVFCAGKCKMSMDTKNNILQLELENDGAVLVEF